MRQDRGRLALQCDPDVDRHALAEQAVIHQRAVTTNGSGAFKRQNAPRGGRSREPHCLADFVVRRSAVALQIAQNSRVEVVERPLPNSLRVFCAYLAGFFSRFVPIQHLYHEVCTH